MYSINLINEKVVPVSQQRTRLSLRLLYVTLWLITGAIYGYYYVTTQAQIDSFSSAARRLESRNSLPPGLKREDVLRLAQQLQTSKGVLTSIQSQSLLWSKKMRQIESHLPDDGWLNKLSCRASTTHFATPQGGRRQPPKPLGEFVIEGMVLIPDGSAGSPSLDRFLGALRTDTVFMEHFSDINHLVVGRERFGTKEVATFVVVCVIQEGIRFDA